MRYFVFILFVITQVIHAHEADTLQLKKPPLPVFEDCDACSSSATGGSGYGNLMFSNFVGLRYLYQNYEAKSGNFGNSPWAVDQFNTYTLQTRFAVQKRIAVSAQVSYHNHNRELTTLKNVNADQTISGVGDALALVFYNLYNTTDNDSLAFNHKINIGAGVKAPLGDFEVLNSSGSNPAFQLGSGSWDYVVALEYLLKRKKIGWSSQLSYVYKTENEYGYQFGNQLNYGASVFYSIDNSALKVFPQLGVQGEVYNPNIVNDVTLDTTRGDVLFGRLGVEFNYYDWGLNINYFNPLNQHLVEGDLLAKNRFSVQLNYLL